MERGAYVEIDGRPAVRFERILDHPVDRVWAAISEPAELAHWFPSRVEHEARDGGTIRFSDDPYADGSTGMILAFDPPHRFAFTWGEDEVHLELSSVEPDRCRLVLIDVLDARDAAARNAAGWTVCLDELLKAIAGAPSDGPHSAENSRRFQPLYDGYTAAGLPGGAAIPDLPSDR
jgi:uncharacterized protein YndB with AHSA1/START domain